MKYASYRLSVNARGFRLAEDAAFFSPNTTSRPSSPNLRPRSFPGWPAVDQKRNRAHADDLPRPGARHPASGRAGLARPQRPGLSARKQPAKSTARSSSSVSGPSCSSTGSWKTGRSSSDSPFRQPPARAVRWPLSSSWEQAFISSGLYATRWKRWPKCPNAPSSMTGT